MNVLNMQGIRKSFGELEVLKDISLTVEEGEVVAVIGPSGSGKSTLLRCATLLERIDGGSITYLDKAVAWEEGGAAVYASPRELREVRQVFGLVFQSFNLIDELNVYENVELPLRYLNISASERKKRVTEILKRMNISHRAKHFPQQLSGGQQQRVAIARAVVSNPKLILADEPTGNLDSKNGKEVMDLLCELNKEGTTIVMVTHSQKDATVAQRIIDLFDGQIVNDVKNLL